VQAVKLTNVTTSAESKFPFWTQRSSKLIAIWEIIPYDSNNQKLMCRWIQI